jgi:hypothetical protein
VRFRAPLLLTFFYGKRPNTIYEFNLLRLACQKSLSLQYLQGLLVVGFKILDSNA